MCCFLVWSLFPCTPESCLLRFRYRVDVLFAAHGRLQLGSLNTDATIPTELFGPEVMRMRSGCYFTISVYLVIRKPRGIYCARKWMSS
jgi:hypothetical protein